MARKKAVARAGHNYTPEKGQEILELAKTGKTNKQIAECMGLTTRTIENWTTQKDDLIKEIKLAKEPTDNTVEATLLQKALGYKYETIKLFFDAKTGTVIEHKYTEFVQPDTTSAIFWLKNRQPEKWRDVKRIDVDSTKDNQTAQVVSELGSKIVDALSKWTNE